jgi:two-component sensor histidine kinase
MVSGHKQQADLLASLPPDGTVLSTGARLWATLARCRAAFAAARRIGHPVYDAPLAGSDADVANHVLSATLSLRSEQLHEANRALAKAADLASTLAEALEHERAAVQFKDLLLREADHRINSSLQALASLQRLRASRSPELETTKALRLSSTQIEAVGRIHAMLQIDPGKAAYLDLSTYLRGVCVLLGEALFLNGDRGEIVVEVEPVFVEAPVGQALGIAVSELVTNALRHAFVPGSPGTVWVQGMPDAGGYRLSIADDGHGLPDGFVVGSSAGFGLRLVTLLATQIGAKLEVKTGRGARIVLSVPTAESSRHLPGHVQHQQPNGLHSHVARSNAS